MRLVLSTNLLGACLFLGCADPSPTSGPQAQLSTSCRDLGEPGTPSEPLALLPEGSCYQFPVRAGDAIRLEIDQIRGDLVATLLSPDGEILLTFDTPVDDDAPEHPCVVAGVGGRYQLQLSATDSLAKAAVRLLRVRASTAADRACAEAAQRFMAAMEHLGGGKTRAVAEELIAVADLWRIASDPLSEAMARRSGARVWRDLAEYPTAEQQLEMTLSAAREAGDSYLEISALNRLGVVRWYRGALEAAESVLYEALVLARERQDRAAEATALNNLALVEETRGHITQAILRLREAEAIQRTLNRPGELALTLQNLAFNLALRDQLREALLILNEAEKLAQKANAGRVRVDCLLIRGWIHRLRGEPEQAESPLREVLQIWRQEGDIVGQAVALDRLGTVLHERGDDQGAEVAYKEALAIVPPSTHPSDLAPTMMGLGCLYQEQGDLEKARSWLDQARRAYQGVEDPISFAHLEYCTSLLEEEMGDLPKAIAHSERAMEIVERLKGFDRSQGARHRPIGLWQNYAERQTGQWVALSEELADPALLERAFSTADYARARSLFELVWEAQLPDQREREEEEALRSRLRELAGARQGLAVDTVGTGTAKAEEIERQATAVALELEDFLAARRSRDPQFIELPTPRPVSVAEVRDLLVPGVVLLRYVLSEPQSFLFVLDGGSLKVYRLASRSVLEAYGAGLHQALRESAEDPELAALLARSTAEELLPGGALPEGTHTLWVVPDGALHYVSFAALIPEGPVPGRALGEQFTLRYLPSAGVGVALKGRARRRPAAPLTLALFADPVFSDFDERLKGASGLVATTSRKRGIALERLPTGLLPRLPYTSTEAAAILALLSPSEARSFLDFAAGKSAVQNPALRRYRILHFATHAFVDELLPELSGLVLSRYRADGAAVDGNLYLHEIFALRFNADLVILSGCQTALGRSVRGDGLLSMTRGFFHAGASQVLVSLWSVDDEATATLMAEFYRAHLDEGHSAAEALRIAQQQLRENPRWRAPYYWAPFVLEGIEAAR